MLVVKAILVICFLCVGFSCNWLNADRSQNCEKIDRSIPSIFRLPVLVHKYCYIGDTKQVPAQLKFKNLLLLSICCVAMLLQTLALPILYLSVVDPFAIKALSCMTS